MDALTLLINRASARHLSEPAPNAEQREYMFRAALRVPDHGHLQPWRFICIEGAARHTLGELLCSALLHENPDAPEEARAKDRNAPLRAPLIIAVIACLKAHPKIPQSEQILSAACAAHALLYAAYAQGFGAIWRTGKASYHPLVAHGLGLTSDEKNLGFIYVGTPTEAARPIETLAVADFVTTGLPSLPDTV